MRDRFWLEEVIEQCDRAATYAADDDTKSTYAMLKATENVWEAAKSLSGDVLARLFPDEEEMNALRKTRDYYSHQYHRIDPAVARATATRDLPRIAERARHLIDGLAQHD